MFKQCNRCRESKPYVDFQKRSDAPDGYMYHCRECAKKRGAAWYRKNKTKHDAVNKAWAENNQERWRELHAIKASRRRAAQRGVVTIHFTADQLSARWDYYGRKCWLCPADATESDHVKPIAAGGAHILANLRPICRPCNASKSATWPFVKPREGISIGGSDLVARCVTC